MNEDQTSSLNDAFYRHFFGSSDADREVAANALDLHFQQMKEEGASPYELMRQLICGTVNAQERRDKEEVQQSEFVKKNGRPASSPKDDFRTDFHSSTRARGGRHPHAKTALLAVISVAAFLLAIVISYRGFFF